MLRYIAQLFFQFSGWRLVGSPPERSAVIIGAYHTSNWDFPKFLMVKWATGMKARWLAKHTLFRGPFDYIFRALGGIPVDRQHPGRLVEDMKERFETEDHVLLVITPEGTRGAVPTWKSGFYRIAAGADVPVVLGFVDHRTKQIGFGPMITLSGDVGSDMDRIRDFYEDKVGKNPTQHGVIKLAEESR